MNCLAMLAAICGMTAVLSIASPTTCLAATYSVSTSGSDSNSGTAGSPFATLYKAVSVVNPGDTVDINGGTYTLSQSPVSITRSGTSAAPITIQSTPGQSAILDASKVSEKPNEGIDIKADHILVKNLTVENALDCNLVIENGNYCTIKNCEFRGAQWIGVGIGISWDKNFVTHDAIVGCKVHDNAQVNLHGKSSGWGGGLTMTNCAWCRATGNSVYHNWGEGLDCWSHGGQVRGTSNNWITHNTVSDNFSVELYISNTQNDYIADNLIYADAQAPLRDGSPAIGISMDNEQAEYPDKDCLILNNVVIGGDICIRYAGPKQYSGFYAGGLDGFVICNNVFYNGKEGCVYIENDPHNNFAFRSNISWEPNNSVLIAQNGGGGSARLSNNCWDGKGANNMAGEGDVVLSNIDPGFVDIASRSLSGWTLKSSSSYYLQFGLPAMWSWTN